MNKRVSFHTFGCRLNQAETASIRSSFRNQGYQIVNDNVSSDVVVINTCTVTKHGDTDTRKLVNRIAKENPDAQIALIGCQAQVQAETLSQMQNVRWVVGNARKMELRSIMDNDSSTTGASIFAEAIPKGNFKVEYSSIDQSTTRANLKIQDGCDFFCFFCVIPYARGRARSREFHDLVREAKNLVSTGFKEIVLTGVNIGTYKHGDREFIDIVSTLEQIEGLERLRISSIEPTTIPHEILDKMHPTSVLCRHLHIPIQSGSDDVLFKMNRRYSIGEYTSFISEALKKVKNICIGTDIIVGYPGESSDLFDQTVDVVKTLEFAYLHVFSYSERESAKSKKFSNQISENIIRNRSRVLRKLSDQKRKAFMEKFIDTTQFVLIETKKTNLWTGLTDNFIRVKIPSDLNLHNEFVPVRIKRIDGREVIGDLI